MLTDKEHVLKTFGLVIRELRQQHGLSGNELAKRIGLKSPAHLYRIERGEIEPVLTTIQSIATVFDMDFMSLINMAKQRVEKEN